MYSQRWIITMWTHTCNPTGPASQEGWHCQHSRSSLMPPVPHPPLPQGDLIPRFLTLLSLLVFEETLHGIVEDVPCVWLVWLTISLRDSSMWFHVTIIHSFVLLYSIPSHSTAHSTVMGTCVISSLGLLQIMLLGMSLPRFLMHSLHQCDAFTFLLGIYSGV